MGKSLVIVESPAKAKTINKYLGKDYVVKSSVGHIRDLPTSGSAAKPHGDKTTMLKKESGKETRQWLSLVRRMGVDPDHDWKANYVILPGKEKVLSELQKLAKNADSVYLATDLDREGEAIAWHLREVIGGDEGRFKRVTFSEITKTAIQSAFDEPSELNMDRVHAQQARRFLDRVVGFMVSPLLWKKVARGLSAGRVQSVATRLVVEREREIKAFVPDEYWECHADLAASGGPDQFRAQVTKCDGEAYKPTSEAESQAAVAILEKADYSIAKREDKPTRSRPPAPFITSSLQQAASVRLGFSVKKTMTLAQRLYEAGFITYMRTDSRNLSGDAVNACRTLIAKKYGDDYVPEKPNVYASGDGAQEAHEAIRPTDVRTEAEDLEKLEKDQQRLYDLIWRQFVACQMPPAVYDTTAFTIAAANYELRARGRVLRFPGHLAAMPPAKSKDGDDATLPDLQQGAALDLKSLDPTQHFTKPPPRYSEASLVRELEKQGIGRPSTYASIISTIQDRGYVRLVNRRMYAEKMGEIVTDRLVESFDRIMDYGFTAALEEELDQVANGDDEWQAVLDRFYKRFTAKLKAADSDMRTNDPVVVEDIQCPKCERPMAIRTARTGVFLSCTGYGLPKKENPCKETINLVPGEEAEAVDSDDDEASEVDHLRKLRRCAKCGQAMDSYLVDEGRKLWVCGNNPDCDGHEIENGEFKIKGYDGPILECDRCGADMQLLSGRFGKYFSCTAEDCKNTRKLLRNGEPAPPKMDPVKTDLPCEKAEDVFLIRDGAAGLFLAASSYPRVRETRNPRVTELKPYRDQLPEKYHHIVDAPAEDPDGNPTLIRFAKKSKEHYISGEGDDGKPTNRNAFFENGAWKWNEVAAKTAVKKKAAKKTAKKKTAAKKTTAK